MLDSLYRTFRIRLENISTAYVRNHHDKILWNSRLIAILGARGVGKSTLILQHIKLHEDIRTSLYVSADDIYFSTHNLVDLAEKFYQEGGQALYIDEIHKYPNWSTEIKNIYDTYPALRIIYTGSSILDLKKGEADLSRRKLEYRLPGLSFREYLAIGKGIQIPVHSLEQVLANNIAFPYQEHRPIALFKEYLKTGYYPYFQESGYYIRLQNVINQILENDIPGFADMTLSTSQKLKKLLYIIAQSVPFKPNYSKLARDLDMNRNLVADLMVHLEKAQLINILRDNTHGISLLGKVDKIYLNNPNLAYALSDSTPDIGNIRETIFLTLLKETHSVVSSSVADFQIGTFTFEVGGKNKKQKQIQGIENAFIVKDDIEYGYQNVLPLWAFGLTY
ncbi:ATP-binding protein [Odoribacter lunatus]|uniref:ATP-binding protein n=1 Tax=Odoribacter lunatus TaxID=2941335 RepID=UPI00203B96AE|nr:AAA family ATPase [Odoribacter lunatus]